MPEPSHQTLQEFFDSPLAKAARFNLSASAAEPVSSRELLDLEPGARAGLQEVALDYPRRHGSDALVNLVAARYPGFDADDIILTSGLDDGLAMLFLALVETGDRVVVLTPCYPPHLQLPRWRGAEVVPWAARAENGWRPDLDELEQLTRDRTRLVIATFPQNPTGFMPDGEFARELVALLAQRNIPLLADEIYAGLPQGTVGDATDLATRHESVISLHGLSKTCGLPGLRMGWLASRNGPMLDAVREVRKLFNCYVPAPVDYLAQLALRHESALIARNSLIALENLDHAARFFERHGNLFEWTAPATGVLSFPRWLGPGGSKAFSDRLLEEAAITFAPSRCFEAGDAHLRLSVARRSFAPALGALDTFLAGAFA